VSVLLTLFIVVEFFRGLESNQKEEGHPPVVAEPIRELAKSLKLGEMPFYVAFCRGFQRL